MGDTSKGCGERFVNRRYFTVANSVSGTSSAVSCFIQCPISSNKLQRRLRMWVEKLSIGTVDRPLRNMFRNGKVLCFNYTEFVETLYGVSEENVCYIHSCRRRKRGHPKETLILGHAPGASEEAYDFEDNSTIGTRAPYKIHMIEAAQEQALHLVS